MLSDCCVAASLQHEIRFTKPAYWSGRAFFVSDGTELSRTNNVAAEIKEIGFLVVNNILTMHVCQWIMARI